MRYILLIYQNTEAWNGLSQVDKDVFMHAAGDIVQELSASGEWVDGQGLADASQARSTHVRDGIVTVTDGPFLEATEALVGYCIVDVATPHRAEEIAARWPDAQRWGMEVRALVHGGEEEGRPTLTLYEHPFALYCQKVLVALNEQGVDYEVLEEQRDFDRTELAELWPPESIPVLRDGDQVIGESSIIIEHVAGARLVPSLEARKWDRICDQYVSNAVQEIVLDTIEERFDERTVARARGRLDMAYGMLEAQLAANEFVAGDTLTIADCAAAPGLFYALAIHPWDEGTHPQLTRYYRALAQRPSVAKVIADARPYRHLFPLPWPADFDRYH